MNKNTKLIKKILDRASAQDIPSKDIEIIESILLDNERISLPRLFLEDVKEFLDDILNMYMYYSLQEHCMTGFISYLNCKRVPIAE